MPSHQQTIEKARRVRDLYRELRSEEAVAKRVDRYAPALVREYLERNSHQLNCPPAEDTESARAGRQGRSARFVS
jgi:hypothetical protein